MSDQAQDLKLFDIAALDSTSHAEKGVAWPVVDLRSGRPFTNADGSPVTITIAGRQSTHFEVAMKPIREKLTKLPQGKVRADDEIWEDDTRVLCAVTRNWNIDSFDGKTPFPATPENIFTLWNDKRMQWLRNAAWDFMARDTNFLAYIVENLPPSPDITSS